MLMDGEILLRFGNQAMLRIRTQASRPNDCFKVEMMPVVNGEVVEKQAIAAYLDPEDMEGVGDAIGNFVRTFKGRSLFWTD